MNAGFERIKEILGKDVNYLPDHQSNTFDKKLLPLPSPGFMDKVFKI